MDDQASVRQKKKAVLETMESPLFSFVPLEYRSNNLEGAILKMSFRDPRNLSKGIL